MPDLQIALVHAGARQDQTITTGTKAWELFADDTSVIAARIGGELKDLAHELVDGDVVEGVAIDSADGHDILRHSTAHVMAQAVQQLYPDAKLGIGPPIVDGFYYDFDVETPFVPEDLAKIETAMRKIIKDNQRFSRRVVADDEARTELADEPYKLELSRTQGGFELPQPPVARSPRSQTRSDEAARGGRRSRSARGELTIYDNLRPQRRRPRGSDLCRGPHLPTTKRIPAFKLMRTAAAYWRGRREEPAASADLRHRLGVQGGA